ncbi:MAG: hypothetical protein CME07_00965 [Gemmatimonadetes bacterium]|nr:hypothetical protein [Gemmatimonadota bacterium]
MRLSRGLVRALKGGVSLGLLGWIAHRYGGDAAFRSAITKLEPRTWLLSLGCLAVGLGTSAARWKVLLEGAGVSVPYSQTVRLYFQGYFFNTFLPTTVGGDVARGLGIEARHPATVVAGSILVERILGFACLLVIGLAAALTHPELALARGILLGASAVFVVGLLLLLALPLPSAGGDGAGSRLWGGMRRTALEVRAYGFRPGALVTAGVLSLGWQALLIASNAILSAGLGGVAPVKSLVALVPVVQATTMIPVSFGGLGVRETAYEVFFRASGFEASGAVALSLSWLAVSLTLAMIGGVLTLFVPIARKGGRDD